MPSWPLFENACSSFLPPLTNALSTNQSSIPVQSYSFWSPQKDSWVSPEGLAQLVRHGSVKTGKGATSLSFLRTLEWIDNSRGG